MLLISGQPRNRSEVIDCLTVNALTNAHLGGFSVPTANSVISLRNFVRFVLILSGEKLYYKGLSKTTERV
jgi:hypothetical protein